jgi:hypothetical protein
MFARFALSAGVIKPILLTLKLIQKNYNIPIAFNRCGLLSAYVYYDLIFTPENMKYISTLPSPKPLDFDDFMNILSSNRNGYSNTNVIPQDLISKVLARRTPLFNNFSHDKRLYPDNMPRKTYIVGSLICYDYLGALQLKMLEKLISSRDLRFEKEATDFLNYLLAPLDEDLFDMYKMAEVDARCNYTSDSFKDLKVALLRYLNIFRKKRELPEIDPYTGNKELVNTHHFMPDTGYYSSKKWQSLIKGPPTEEDLKKQDKIAEDFRNKTGIYKQYDNSNVDAQ